ncbi:unnamed protein product [Phytomonas sp. Hart1]|nr:unnamed protein product [Phytomonas sp. Hart1]|eukprot:CCW70625.1 unnamed protein product [Phytomonas sp. isolate Hart1]
MRLEDWQTEKSSDLSHLWIAPYSDNDKARNDKGVVYLLRVMVSSRVGYARLSIHDSAGRQLDDGNIPCWSAGRVCYPQVTFGGRIGRVSMVEPPHSI